MPAVLQRPAGAGQDPLGRKNVSRGIEGCLDTEAIREGDAERDHPQGLQGVDPVQQRFSTPLAQPTGGVQLGALPCSHRRRPALQAQQGGHLLLLVAELAQTPAGWLAFTPPFVAAASALAGPDEREALPAAPAGIPRRLVKHSGTMAATGAYGTEAVTDAAAATRLEDSAQLLPAQLQHAAITELRLGGMQLNRRA